MKHYPLKTRLLSFIKHSEALFHTEKLKVNISRHKNILWERSFVKVDISEQSEQGW